MKRLFCMLAAGAGLMMAQGTAPDPSALNVELTVYLLSGTTGASGSDDVPADLAGTVKTLHGLFTYKSYKLAESFILRGRNSTGNGFERAQTDGILPGTGFKYAFSYNRVRVSAEKPRMVHIDGLMIRLSKPGPMIYAKDGKRPPDESIASISTDLDLGDGQKTVVGKSSINAAGDALILVIVPKVIE